MSNLPASVAPIIREFHEAFGLANYYARADGRAIVWRCGEAEVAEYERRTVDHDARLP